MHSEAQATHSQWWRVVRWGGAAALLVTPLVAMQFTDEVQWTLSDFVVFAAMLGGAGLAYEALARRSGSAAYRFASALALVGAFLLIWVNLAVGIIGSEDNPANWMFAGVLAIGTGAAIVSHFHARGMAKAMTAAALAQLTVGGIALIGNLNDGEAGPRPVIVLTLFFTAAWLISAALYRKAARRG